MKIIGIVQPTYIPWLPFFERMLDSDVFVYLDDVKYSKNSWHNRNAVKSSQNSRTVLTVPVRYRGHSDAFINEIEVDNNRSWQMKHWRTIQNCYAKAPFFDQYKDELEEIYAKQHEKLIDVLMPLIELIKRELGIKTLSILSSELGVAGSGNEKLVNLCKHFDGTHFIVKPNTQDYHPQNEFLPKGIDFKYWQPTALVYPQLHGEFEPGLGALDYLMNCGSVDFKARLVKFNKQKIKTL
jgi:hypothetical protein